jgi:hypothetical protein
MTKIPAPDKGTHRGRGRPRKYEEGTIQGFPLRVPVELYGRLSRLASDAGASINDVVVLAVREWFRTEPKPTASRVHERLEAAAELSTGQRGAK